MKVKEAIELINNSDNCYNLDDAFKLLIDCKFIKRQDYYNHRWDITAIDIYEVDNGYIGVKGIAELKSEMMDFSDCDEHYVAEEYKAVPTITYVPKTK